MFSNRVENNVGKGEIAHYEQFLLFLLCFQKTCTADALKLGFVWERLNMSSAKALLFRQVLNLGEE